jgi:hypothetical protein
MEKKPHQEHLGAYLPQRAHAQPERVTHQAFGSGGARIEPAEKLPIFK